MQSLSLLPGGEGQDEGERFTNLSGVLISQAVSLSKEEENSLRFGATLSKN
jgi:hypothetical protein